MTPDQFFKTFHHHWSECDWPVVVEAGNVEFLGQGDDDGGLQTGWDSGLGQGTVVNPGEDSSQLVRAVLRLPMQRFCVASFLSLTRGLGGRTSQR